MAAILNIDHHLPLVEGAFLLCFSVKAYGFKGAADRAVCGADRVI